MNMKQGNISRQDINLYDEQYKQDKVKKVIANSIAKSGLQAAAYKNDTLRDVRHMFSIDIKTMPVTNQKASGRCWLFAGLNLLRENIAGSKNLEEFELSQNYIAFWDKFEKANYFLESVLLTLDEPAEGRLISWLMGSYQDGGQWDMFVNLIEKYGVVPKQAMPETYHSSSTGGMNYVVNTLLRKTAADFRRQYKAGTAVAELRRQKESLLSDIYGMLCQCFGRPPEKFDWEYVDKDKKYFRVPDLTPRDFAKQFVSCKLDNYVSIIHAPTEDKPYGETFTVKYIGNVVGGNDILYLNLPLPEFKQLVIDQLKDEEVVWFGSDVSHGGDREAGSWYGDLYDYDGLLSLDLQISKEDSLNYRHSAMNHAMVITGVNLADDKPTRWKIENSWGDKNGDKGYYVADDNWFDKYVYQAVINKKHLSPSRLEDLKKAPKKLEPWDPMGTLA